MTKLLLLDLDGTIRRCKSNPSGFINKPDDQEIIEGADKALEKYVAQGWIALGVSNQGGVEKGYKSLEACVAEQYYTLQLFQSLSGILFCPDMSGLKINRLIDEDIARSGIFRDKQKDHQEFNKKYQGTYRKPNPGMIRYAIQMTMIPPIDCLMIGDRPEDEQAAVAAGINFMWADLWREQIDKREY